MTFLTLTGPDVRTVSQARRLWYLTRDRIARRHPLTASVGVVHFANGRAHVHALLSAPRPVPHRTARAAARAGGWGPIAHIKPILDAGEASKTSIYVTSQLRGAHAWPKGGKQLRVTAFSRSWDRMSEQVKPVSTPAAIAPSMNHNGPAGVDNGVLPAIAGILRAQGLDPAPGLEFGLSVRELAASMGVGRRVASHHLGAAVQAGAIEPVAEAKGQRSPRWRTGPQSLWRTECEIADDAPSTGTRPVVAHQGCEISETGRKILAVLDHGPCSPGKLAEDRHPNTITKSLDRLEERGAIHRTHRLITLIPEAGGRCGSQVSELSEREPTSSDPSSSVAVPAPEVPEVEPDWQEIARRALPTTPDVAKPPERRPLAPLFDHSVYEESKARFLAAHPGAVALQATTPTPRRRRSAPQLCRHGDHAGDCGTCKATRAMVAEEAVVGLSRWST